MVLIEDAHRVARCALQRFSDDKYGYAIFEDIEDIDEACSREAPAESRARAHSASRWQMATARLAA